MFEIHRVAAYKNNYIWIVTHCGDAWVVDPGDHLPVIEFLEQRTLALKGILITHRHWDHVTGVAPLLEHLAPAAVPVYGPDSPTIAHLITRIVNEGDRFYIGPLQAQVWHTPGHTLDHISYYFAEQDILFCGDTLFACGCGKLFDGTALQLYHSLRRIAQLPGKTALYCTHEYTLANIGFALEVEPHNAQLQARQTHCQRLRMRNQATLPTGLALELATNPFLRSDRPEVQAAVEKHTGTSAEDAISCFSALRNWKNRY